MVNWNSRKQHPHKRSFFEQTNIKPFDKLEWKWKVIKPFNVPIRNEASDGFRPIRGAPAFETTKV